jgi:enoyl-[acyl-carrier-protein] reductase (NADH)
MKSLVQQAGKVDILVNTAAGFPGALPVDQEVASFEMTFDTTVRGHGSIFLASPRSSFTTGSTLHADVGGSAV